MPEFVDGLRDVVLRNGANLLNVTIRTVHKDEITALPYATTNMFGLVLYFNVQFKARDNEILRKTTADLIDVAHQCEGTHYLPYQLFYSRQQLKKSIPASTTFSPLKRSSIQSASSPTSSTKSTAPDSTPSAAERSTSGAPPPRVSQPPPESSAMHVAFSMHPR